MAVKRYRNLLPFDPTSERQTLIGVDEAAGFSGGGPGEVFEFDYDRPGYDGQALIDAGLIESVDKPTKEELNAIAEAGKEA